MRNRKRNTVALVTGVAAIAGLSIATGAPALATAMPATGDYVTTTLPGPSPSTGASVTETGAYLYKKVKADKPAAWENSGEQFFLAKKGGDLWFTDVTSLVSTLPFVVCGPGWAVQQDVLEFKGEYAWPERIEYPNTGFPGNAPEKSKHQELEELMTVPDCEKQPSDKPSQTPPLSGTPSNTPPADKPSDKPADKPSQTPPLSGTPSNTPADTPSQTPTTPPTSGAPASTPAPSGAPASTPPSYTPSQTPTTPPTSNTPASAILPAGSGGNPPAAGNTAPRVPDAGLAHTGATGTWLAAAGAAVLALGALMVGISRRRKASA